jgi:hypothetical protein
LAIALIAAGCSGSTSGSPYSSAPYGSAGERLERRRRRGQGRRRELAARSHRRQQQGRTLYLFEKDKKRRSACYGQSATYWLPLLSHGKPLARSGVKQSLLGTTRRANSAEQVTSAVRGFQNPGSAYRADGCPGLRRGGRRLKPKRPFLGLLGWNSDGTKGRNRSQTFVQPRRENGLN